MELTQVRLLVDDFPACYRFYRDVLGLVPQFEAEAGPYAKFETAGGAGVALQLRADLARQLPRAALPPTGVRALTVLRVDDLAAACAALAERGVLPVAGPQPVGDRLTAAHFADPEGNLVELQEWLLTRSAR